MLKEASEGLNPFEGFTPELADGESLIFGTEEFDAMEAKGLEAAAKTAFVLVSCTVPRPGVPRHCFGVFLLCPARLCEKT